MLGRLPQSEVRMREQERFQHALVLLDRERAGAVHELPSGFDKLRRQRHQAGLSSRAGGHQSRRPLAARVQVAAHHALAGARRVEQHQVEASTPLLGQSTDARAGDHARQTKAVKVPGQHGGPGWSHVVRDDQRLGTGKLRQVRGLTAGGGRQVEYRAARPRVGGLRDRHCAGLLHVIPPGCVQWVSAEVGRMAHVPPARAPRNGTQYPRQPGQRAFGKARRDPNAVHPRPIQGLN